MSKDYMFENHKSLFSISMHGTKISIEKTTSDLSIDELLDVFRSLALSAGFSEETWDRGIIDLSNECLEFRRWNRTYEEYPDFQSEVQ